MFGNFYEVVHQEDGFFENGGIDSLEDIIFFRGRHFESIVDVSGTVSFSVDKFAFDLETAGDGGKIEITHFFTFC